MRNEECGPTMAKKKMCLLHQQECEPVFGCQQNWVFLGCFWASGMGALTSLPPTWRRPSEPMNGTKLLSLLLAGRALGVWPSTNSLPGGRSSTVTLLLTTALLSPKWTPLKIGSYLEESSLWKPKNCGLLSRAKLRPLPTSQNC